MASVSGLCMSEFPELIPVILETPYAGDVERNLAYLQAFPSPALTEEEPAEGEDLTESLVDKPAHVEGSPDWVAEELRNNGNGIGHGDLLSAFAAGQVRA